MKHSIDKTLAAAITAALTASLCAGAYAHTRFEISTMAEGTRVSNNLVIGHACGADTRVFGTSVVFPDGVTSTSIKVDGEVYEGALTDYVSNWGPNIQPLFNRAVFDEVDEKNDVNGNVVGFWAGAGPGMPNHLNAFVPFRVNPVNIEPSSCAVSVRFFASVVDICQVSTAENLHDEGVAHFWTHNNLGTIFDRVSGSDDGPAPLTITRNLTTNPLPEGCGDGVAVEVRPSAEQIERDMPIYYQGVQAWPAP